MSDNEVRLTSPSGGRKGQKVERYDLIPAEPLRLLARHFGVGAEKYTERDADGNIVHDGADNWRLGYDWRMSFAALNRHLWQFWAGEDIDAETGTPHIIAVAWHALVLDEFSRIHPEYDTRTSTLDARAAAAAAVEANGAAAAAAASESGR